jgi:hypothetical protein
VGGNKYNNMEETIDYINSYAPLHINDINQNGKYLVWTEYEESQGDNSLELSADGDTVEEALNKLKVLLDLKLAEI